MYARVIPLQLKPDFVDDFLIVYQQHAIPDFLQRPGFAGALVLHTQDTHQGMLVSLWDSKEDVRRSQSHSQRIVSAMLLPFLAFPPTSVQYQVCVQAGQYIGGKAARTLTLPIAGEQLDETLAMYNESVLPELKQQPGFQGVFWFADRSAGSGLGLSLWTSPEAMRAADEPGAFFPNAAGTLAAFFRAKPAVEYYTVSHQL